MKGYAIIMVLLASLIGTANSQVLIDFDDIELGTLYQSPEYNQGDTLFTVADIHVSLTDFLDLDTASRLFNLQVRDALNSGFTESNIHYLRLGGGIELDFRNYASEVRSVYFFYRQGQDNVRNIGINGEIYIDENFESMATQDLPDGLELINRFYGNRGQGVVAIIGDLQTLRIAGEILDIDHIMINDSTAIEVYPGDANNDGICNYLDIMNLGLHYGAAGAGRLDDGLVWEGQKGILWSESALSNAGYSDVDGSGKIDTNDLNLLLTEHFGKRHSGVPDTLEYVKGSSMDEFSMFFRERGGNDTIQYTNSSEPFDFYLDVFLVPGNEQDSLYGISWLWKFDPDKFGTNGAPFVYKFDTDLGDDNVLFTALDTSRIDAGVVGCVMVRSDGNNSQIRTTANLGTFNGIIVDLKGFQSSGDGNLDLDSIRAINNVGTPVPVFDLDLPVYFDPITDLLENPYYTNQISLYPNPGSSISYLHIDEILLNQVSSVEIVDIMGRSLETKRIDSDLVVLNTNYPSGTYFAIVHFRDFQPFIYRFGIE